ncbi:MAG: SAM-dependent chlorinase/fluorinase [Chloroflexi bacterium]|nr:SAM-dependent chlorinase/fluorinase [Chloroflexota bacterium]
MDEGRHVGSVVSVISLTTDFGAADPWVGVMKSVVLGINPGATLVDLTHDVAPGDVAGAAFLFGTAYRYLPPGSVHVLVVDPGVGSARRALVVDSGRELFVAPDNGLLTYALRDGGATLPQGATPFAPGTVALPPGWRVWELANPRYWLHPVSRTFHGRDIFAPVAAHLSLGVPPQEMGPPVAEVVALAVPAPRREPDGALVGHVLHVDRFGNLLTNIPEADVSPDAVVEVAGRRLRGLSSSYAEGAGLLAIIGSHGCLEIALTNASAAAALGVRRGAEVRVKSAG